MTTLKLNPTRLACLALVIGGGLAMTLCLPLVVCVAATVVNAGLVWGLTK